MNNEEQRLLGELVAKVESVIRAIERIDSFVERADDRYVCKRELNAIKVFTGCLISLCTFVGYLYGKG